jgi:hypothetical protein
MLAFTHFENAYYTHQTDQPNLKKENIDIEPEFYSLLLEQHIATALPISYYELLNYHFSTPILINGKASLWEKLNYNTTEYASITKKLQLLYTQLYNNLTSPMVEQISFCEYGNSFPFKITYANGKIIYVKKPDASRLLGNILENVFNPDPPFKFLLHNNTFVETHIEGQEAFAWLKQLPTAKYDKPQLVQIAKAFVQFNQYCNLRLLGDMRNYNFHIIETNGAFQFQSIDFDQQNFEEFLPFYFPAFYKDNVEFVNLVKNNLLPKQIQQAENETLVQIKQAITNNADFLEKLFMALESTELSFMYKAKRLAAALNTYWNTNTFSACTTMLQVLQCQFKHIQKQ